MQKQNYIVHLSYFWRIVSFVSCRGVGGPLINVPHGGSDRLRLEKTFGLFQLFAEKQSWLNLAKCEICWD